MHLFLFATSKRDSATEIEPVTPAVELSDRRNPTGPVVEVEIATPSVSLEAATKQQLAGSDSTGYMALASVAQSGTFSETPRFIASTQEQIQVALEDRPQITAKARVGDPPLPAPASANISVTLEEQPHITSEARVGDQTPPVSAIAILQEQPPMTAEARVENQTQPVSAIGSISIALTQQPHVTGGALVGGQKFLLSASANVSSEPATKPQGPELVDNSSLAQETIRYIPDTTQPQDSKHAEDSIQQTASIAATVPNPDQSSVKVALRKGIHERSLAQASNPKRAPKLAMATQHEQALQVAPRGKQIGSARVDLSRSLTESQPKRRDTMTAAKEKLSSKLAAKPNPRPAESSQASSRWKPMALAPADKPSRSLTQSQPKKPDARGYNANIWSALARKKPHAGQRGSTTVTFGIGAAGVLQFVRVSHSSGNARLDQLALATVRNAAPFPPPPAPQAATYAIRIDFH
jgi:protein TonB